MNKGRFTKMCVDFWQSRALFYFGVCKLIVDSVYNKNNLVLTYFKRVFTHTPTLPLAKHVFMNARAFPNDKYL